MKTLKYIGVSIGMLVAVAGCKDTMKENKKEARVEAQTPVLKEQWKSNNNDWTEGEDRATITAHLSNENRFDQFGRALRSADLHTALDSLESATLFVPTNEAFEQLNERTLAILKTPGKQERLTEILKYHIVEGKTYDAESLRSTIRMNEGQLRLKTMQGGYIALTLKDGDLTITDEMGTVSAITMAEMRATDGVIHGIEAMLMPQ